MASLVTALVAWMLVGFGTFGIVVPYLGVGLVLAALAFGILGLMEVSQDTESYSGGTQAIWGLGLSGVLLVMGVILPWVSKLGKNDLPVGLQAFAQRVEGLLHAVSIRTSKPAIPDDLWEAGAPPRSREDEAAQRRLDAELAGGPATVDFLSPPSLAPPPKSREPAPAPADEPAKLPAPPEAAPPEAAPPEAAPEATDPI